MPNPVFSFEFYPPKDFGTVSFPNTVSEFAELNPAFIDLTYGAGGGELAAKRAMLDTTADTADIIRDHAPDVPVIIHVPNNRFRVVDVKSLFYAFWMKEGISHFMAMGGDGPHLHPKYGFKTTEQLITGLCRARRGTAYPPGVLDLTVVVEPEKPDAMDRLEGKLDAVPAGLRHLAKISRAVMQCSFDTGLLIDFYHRAVSKNLGIEIVPGFMPIGGAVRRENLTSHRTEAGVLVNDLGVKVPEWVIERFDTISDDDKDAVRETAVDIATRQLRTVADAGINRFHFFAANRRALTLAVMKEVWPDLVSAPAAAGNPHGPRSLGTAVPA